MSRIQVWNMAGEEVKKMNIKNEVFGIEPNTAVMHAAVVNYLANQRQGTQSTLTRTEVSGGGRKPWRQKALAMQDRARFVHRSGRTAAWLSVRNRVITATP